MRRSPGSRRAATWRITIPTSGSARPLVLRAIYEPAGEALFVALAIVALVITAVVVVKLSARLVHGAVTLPTTWRRIGDPSEWKGKVRSLTAPDLRSAPSFRARDAGCAGAHGSLCRGGGCHERARFAGRPAPETLASNYGPDQPNMGVVREPKNRIIRPRTVGA